jgi:predicted porin
MKKSLLAVAAMGAFASAAQAQSSVTVYGIMDVGYISQSVKNAGTIGTTGAQSAGAGNAGYGVGQSRTNGFGNSAETTSRLGFKGTEDLGGGANAFFTVEIGLQQNAAATLQANNRQSFAGLGKKGLGAVSIGTQYTPIHEAVAATDAGQQNNMPGDVIYPADNSVNSANTTGAYPAPNAPNAGTQGGPGTGSTGYTVRAANSLKFVSDKFAGFQGKAMYVQASNTTNASSTTAAGVTTLGGGVTASTGYALGVDYTWQKLLVTANMQQFKQETTAGTVTNATGQFATSQTISGVSWPGAALNTKDTQSYLAGTYDFGILKAYVQYINRKMDTKNNSNIYTKRTGQQIGVRSNITPTIETWAQGGTGKVTNNYIPVVGNNATSNVGATLTTWQLGSNYWLSKRTNLYAIVGQERTGNAVYPQTVNGTTAGNNAVSNGISGYALGMRHTF